MIALWDLGNVVVEWNPERILQRLNLSTKKTSIIRSDLFENTAWLDLDQGLTTEAEVATQLANSTELDHDELLRCFDTVRETLVDLPRSVELIRQMKQAGIPMYVLSNMSAENIEYLRQRDYFELFDGIVVSAEEKLIKPDISLFQRVIDRYQLEPAQMVFMDDSLPNIEAAISLGMHAVHFKGSDDCYAAVKQHFDL